MTNNQNFRIDLVISYLKILMIDSTKKEEFQKIFNKHQQEIEEYSKKTTDKKTLITIKDIIDYQSQQINFLTQGVV